MHPDFFKQKHIQHIPDGVESEEKVLDLKTEEILPVTGVLPENVTFGYYTGDRQELLNCVKEVDEYWPEFFQEEDPVYCAYVNGEIASFCLVEDMCRFNLNGQTLKIAGPGCVGTRPQYRKQGIGRTMIRKVTEILQEKGYDYSYIHYTGVAPWYAKLGYRTVLKWDRNGIL